MKENTVPSCRTAAESRYKHRFPLAAVDLAPNPARCLEKGCNATLQVVRRRKMVILSPQSAEFEHYRVGGYRLRNLRDVLKKEKEE